MIFAQPTVSGTLAIAVAWLTKDLLVSDQPMQRHIAVIWFDGFAKFTTGVSIVEIRIY